jgi:hypothetical protein
MKPAFVDKIKPDEIQEAQDAFNRLKEKNLLDSAVFAYPATAILRADIEGKKVAFLPVQNCCMLESLGIPENATVSEVASGLKALVQVIVYEARQKGHGELYFACKDEQTAAFAEHHGFEKFDVPMYRLKI